MKRLFDILGALLGMIVLSPLIAVVALAVKLTSDGPVFYRGVRTGRFGRPFRIFKFRSMVVNSEQLGGPSTALNDPRLTPIGRLLRKFKLDEIPQLFNILKGEMSFVGPRPQVEKYTRLYSEEEKQILSVRPGLTDYASIRFINLDNLLGDGDVDEKYLREVDPEKRRLCLRYVREQSLLTDLKIIALTVLQMLRIPTLWNTRS